MSSGQRGKRELLSPAELVEQIKGKKILIDTNVIIYLTDQIEPYVSLSKVVFELIEKKQTKGVISVVSIAEVMQGPLKRKNSALAKTVMEKLLSFPNLRCIEITQSVIKRIGEDSRVQWSALRTMDSLIIASALQAGVEKIVSNDLRLKRAVSKEFLVTFDI